jgi:hypothetical protein
MGTILKTLHELKSTQNVLDKKNSERDKNEKVIILKINKKTGKRPRLNPLSSGVYQLI